MIKNLEHKETMYLLSHNYIGYLAYLHKKRPIVVPITYYYNKKDQVIICYSGEGHKVNAMRKNNLVSLSVADIDSVSNWRSVLVEGAFEELIGSDAKSNLHTFSLGVKSIIRKKEQQNLHFVSEFSSKIYNEEVPIVFQIKIQEITGKKRRF